MDDAVRAEGLTKFYGKTRGVEGLDLTVRRGETFGYLGPNGAGKTTTIRLLLDLIRPTSGRAEVLGLDSHRDSLEIRKRIGYLPGELALYENVTGRDFVAHFARLRRMKNSEHAHTLAERLGLDLSRRVGALSKGNKQKLGLVQAFMHEPELLVLDEPTSGLDPLVQHTFHEIVSEATEKGAAVLLSSHVLSEIEHLTDRVGIIRDGKLIVVEEIDALKRKAVGQIEIRFANEVPASEFEGVPGVEEVTGLQNVLTFRVKGSIDSLVKAAARHEVIAIRNIEPDLEQVFLAYYRSDPGAS